MKAFTFLGLGTYQDTTYIKHDGKRTYQTDLFPFAVAELYEPERIIAFTTPKVMEHKKDDLDKLGRKLGEKFTTVNIPNGDSTEELWDIFTKCVAEDVVKENDEIILDITHAFRSIPLLIFIVSRNTYHLTVLKRFSDQSRRFPWVIISNPIRITAITTIQIKRRSAPFTIASTRKMASIAAIVKKIGELINSGISHPVSS